MDSAEFQMDGWERATTRTETTSTTGAAATQIVDNGEAKIQQSLFNWKIQNRMQIPILELFKPQILSCGWNGMDAVDRGGRGKIRLFIDCLLNLWQHFKEMRLRLFLENYFWIILPYI